MSSVNLTRWVGNDRITRSQIIVLRTAARGYSVGGGSGSLTEPNDATVRRLVQRGMLIRSKGQYVLTKKGQEIVDLAAEKGVKW